MPHEWLEQHLLTWRPPSPEPSPGLSCHSGDVDPLQAHFVEVSPKTSCSKPAGVQQLWFCRFPVPLPSELPSAVSAEHCRGTQAWDSLPSVVGDRGWQPRQAQQKVASGPRDAWRGARGGLPAAREQWLGWHSFNSSWIFHSPQECCLGLSQGEGGDSQTRLQSWHIICGVLCLILLLKANPSQKDP